MKRWTFAAAANTASRAATWAIPLVASLAWGGSAARAADLDYGDAPRQHYGAAYDDPRYADIYGRSHGPSYSPRYAPHAEYVPVPREPVYRDRAYDDDRHGERYSEALPPSYGHRTGCVPRQQIRHQLERQGWSGFFAAEPRGDIAALKARRPDGRVFALRIDRCTGEIVDARPVAPQGYGPYANAPRRYERNYY